MANLTYLDGGNMCIGHCVLGIPFFLILKKTLRSKLCGSIWIYMK